MNMAIDVRDILPVVSVPTLVLHRSGDRAIDIAQGRYLAEHIRGAKFTELPGDDHLWWVGDSQAIVNEIQEFLTGRRRVSESDRVLTTVMFTDIVDSTKRASALGDRRWRDLLDRHNSMTNMEIKRFRGRTVKMTGDGVLATFDGPARAVQCACALVDDAQRLGIEIRSAVHTGEVELLDDDVAGIAVHAAARVLENAKPNEVWTSRTVKDLVAGSRIQFIERGNYRLKGLSDEWLLFTVKL